MNEKSPAVFFLFFYCCFFFFKVPGWICSSANLPVGAGCPCGSVASPQSGVLEKRADDHAKDATIWVSCKLPAFYSRHKGQWDLRGGQNHLDNKGHFSLVL